MNEYHEQKISLGIHVVSPATSRDDGQPAGSDGALSGQESGGPARGQVPHPYLRTRRNRNGKETYELASQKNTHQSVKW